MTRPAAWCLRIAGASGPAAWCLRIAGASGIVNGLGFGGFAIPAIVSVGQGHGIIYTFGNPTYGNGPFERIGVPTTVPLLAGFLAACVVQVVGGVLLLWPRPSGIVISVVGMLLGASFWWGFNLPFAWLNAAVVLTFLVLAWMVQNGSSPGPSGGGRSSAGGIVQLRENKIDLLIGNPAGVGKVAAGTCWGVLPLSLS